jgi:predicted amidophosphoribosyltransferase
MGYLNLSRLSMNVKCKYCLQEIPYEATRCPHCAGGFPTDYRPPKDKGFNAIVALWGVVIVVGVIIFIQVVFSH